MTDCLCNLEMTKQSFFRGGVVFSKEKSCDIREILLTLQANLLKKNKV